ncbi:MAG: hypothetical protein AAGA84_02125 [Pseudomonadota bacterium]
MTDQSILQWPRTADWPVIQHFATTAEHECTLSLAVPEDSPWLDGHFPQRAVLPGVVQLRWASQIAARVWTSLSDVKQLNNVKFQNPILPPASVQLTLTYKPEKRTVVALYRDGERIHSRASIVFA